MLITKRVIDLTESEYNRCAELTYGSEGYMLEDLDEAIDHESRWSLPRYTQAILSIEADKIVGWCLLQPAERRSRYIAYFFVDRLHRRQGHGTLLMNEASKWGRYKAIVMPDSSNYGFFDRFPQLCKDIDEETVLQRKPRSSRPVA